MTKIRNITLDPARERIMRAFLEELVGDKRDSYAVRFAEDIKGQADQIFVGNTVAGIFYVWDQYMQAPQATKLIESLDHHLASTTGAGGLGPDDLVAEHPSGSRALTFLMDDAASSVTEFLQKKKRWFTAEHFRQKLCVAPAPRGGVVEYQADGFQRTLAYYTIAHSPDHSSDVDKIEFDKSFYLSSGHWPRKSLPDLRLLSKLIDREFKAQKTSLDRSRASGLQELVSTVDKFRNAAGKSAVLNALNHITTASEAVTGRDNQAADICNRLLTVANLIEGDPRLMRRPARVETAALALVHS